MKTKYLGRFLNRAARFEVDLELADVLGGAAMSGRLTTKDSERIFHGVTESRYPRLAKHKSSNHNRKLIVAHLKATLYSAFVKDLYEDVVSYLTDLVAGAAAKGIDPSRLIGEHKLSLEANDLLKCGSWDGVVKLVASSLFRRLENEKSTAKLLEAIDKKLALGIDKAIIDAALPYIELRHLLVHNDGVADEQFCAKFPALQATPGSAVRLRFDTVTKAKEALVALVTHFDERAIAVDVIPNEDLQA